MPIVPAAPSSPDEMIHLNQARGFNIILKIGVEDVHVRNRLANILGQDIIDQKLGVCAMVILLMVDSLLSGMAH